MKLNYRKGSAMPYFLFVILLFACGFVLYHDWKNDTLPNFISFIPTDLLSLGPRVLVTEIPGLPLDANFYVDDLSYSANGTVYIETRKGNRSTYYIIGPDGPIKTSKPMGTKHFETTSEDVGEGKVKSFTDPSTAYEMAVVAGEPDWKCTLSSIDNGTRKLLIPELAGVGCADVYHDGGKWLVVDWGDIAKTKVYSLSAKKATYLKQLEKLPALKLVYDSKNNIWYGSTITTGADDREYDKLYKITIK